MEKTLSYTILFRYGLTSLIGFFILSSAAYSISRLLEFPPILAYAISLAIIYIVDYVLNLKFVFKSKHSKKKFLGYLLYLCISWFIGTFLFSLIFHIIHQIYYANAVTILVLAPIRFILTNWLLNDKFLNPKGKV